MKLQPKFKAGDEVLRVVETAWGNDMGVLKGNIYKVSGIASNGNLMLVGIKENYESKFFVKATKLHKALL